MKQFRCAFFNFTGGANGTGGWSYSGVQTEVINETHVRCNAAHLTSFVVLVSIVPAADIVSRIIVERVWFPTPCEDIKSYFVQALQYIRIFQWPKVRSVNQLYSFIRIL